MPDKRATHAAERVLLPRKVRECALLTRKGKERGREREIPSILPQRRSLLADAPAIGERAFESDLNDSHNDTHYESLRIFAAHRADNEVHNSTVRLFSITLSDVALKIVPINYREKYVVYKTRRNSRFPLLRHSTKEKVWLN